MASLTLEKVSSCINFAKLDTLRAGSIIFTNDVTEVAAYVLNKYSNNGYLDEL